MACTVVVPEASDVQRISYRTEHDALLGLEDVEQRAAEPAAQRKEAVQDDIGQRSNLRRARLASAGSQAYDGDVDARGTEEDP